MPLGLKRRSGTDRPAVCSERGPVCINVGVRGVGDKERLVLASQANVDLNHKKGHFPPQLGGPDPQPPPPPESSDMFYVDGLQNKKPAQHQRRWGFKSA